MAKAKNDQELSDHRLSLRMTEAELQRVEELRQMLQSRVKNTQYGNYIRVTQKTVVMEALEALELRLKDLERKRRSGEVD